MARLSVVLCWSVSPFTPIIRSPVGPVGVSGRPRSIMECSDPMKSANEAEIRNRRQATDRLASCEIAKVVASIRQTSCLLHTRNALSCRLRQKRPQSVNSERDELDRLGQLSWRNSVIEHSSPFPPPPPATSGVPKADSPRKSPQGIPSGGDGVPRPRSGCETKFNS